MRKTMALMGTVLVLGLVLTACNNPAGNESLAPTSLTAPQIALAGSVVSWNEVAGAFGYSVRIGGTQVSGGELSFNARSFDLAWLGLNAGNHIVTVVAVSSNASRNSEPSNAVTFIVQRLSAPYITLVGSVVSWGEVAGAGGYSVRIGGTQVSGGELGSDARSFDLVWLGLNAGNHIVTVVAIDPDNASRNSEPSNAVTFTVTAGQPEPLPQQLPTPYITLVGSVVSWGEVAGASGYSVRIGGTQVSGGELGSDARSFDLADLGRVSTILNRHPPIRLGNVPKRRAVP